MSEAEIQWGREERREVEGHGFSDNVNETLVEDDEEAEVEVHGFTDNVNEAVVEDDDS